MKFNYLTKAAPFLSSLILITFLSINNQKEYTKLKILIWNTPSLKLGTYLAISTGTGFLVSYFITTKLSIINQKTQKKRLSYKLENKSSESSEYIETNNNAYYDNTLIERDLTDPSPTINASFRVIGNTERTNRKHINNVQSDDGLEYENHYEEPHDKNEISNNVNSIANDWNDESYSIW